MAKNSILNHVIKIKLRPFVDHKHTRNIEFYAKLEICDGFVTVVFDVFDSDKTIQNLHSNPLPSELFARKDPRKNLRKDELWKDTCFEFFVKEKNLPHYYEFNLSPKGEWNFYYLSGYRRGLSPVTEMKGPEFKNISNEHTQISARLNLAGLFEKGSLLQFNICGVLLIDSDPTYWSHKHSIKKPDFHDPECFSIEVPFE